VPSTRLLTTTHGGTTVLPIITIQIALVHQRDLHHDAVRARLATGPARAAPAQQRQALVRLGRASRLHRRSIPEPSRSLSTIDAPTAFPDPRAREAQTHRGRWPTRSPAPSERPSSRHCSRPLRGGVTRADRTRQWTTALLLPARNPVRTLIRHFSVCGKQLRRQVQPPLEPARAQLVRPWRTTSVSKVRGCHPTS
jgi:hypothetical protein